MMNKNTGDGIELIRSLLMEVSGAEYRIAPNIRQQIFQVFRVLIEEITLLNLERDRMVVMSKYHRTNTRLLELQTLRLELFKGADMARKGLADAIGKEVEEMLVLLEDTKNGVYQMNPYSTNRKSRDVRMVISELS